MLGLGLGISSDSPLGGVAFDSDYQAILNYASGEGYSAPNAAQQIAQNTLVTSLKGGANVWDELDGLYVFANNGSEDFGVINWKNPVTAGEANAVNNVVWAEDNGFTGTALASDYIDTNFVPSASSPVTKFQVNSLSVGIYTDDTISSGSKQYPISFDESNYRIRFLNAWSGGNRMGVTSAGLPSTPTAIPPSSTVGLQGMMKSGSGNQNGLQGDGTFTAENTGLTDASLTTNSLYFLRYGGNYSDANIKLGFVGGKFTSTQWSEFVTAVNTYVGTLSP